MLESFVDELVKISASLMAARHMKQRKGKTPIRVHNLLKKAAIEAAVPKVKGLAEFLMRNWKPIAVGGGSIAAYEAGKKNLEALRIGRAYQEQQGR